MYSILSITAAGFVVFVKVLVVVVLVIVVVLVVFVVVVLEVVVNVVVVVVVGFDTSQSHSCARNLQFAVVVAISAQGLQPRSVQQQYEWQQQQ